MMKPFNILFTSSGRRVSLINHFKNSLKQINPEGCIVTADIKQNVPTAYVSDHHVIVPRVHDSNYISSLVETCKKFKISLLIPLIDTELLLLSENKITFDKLGVTVLVCSSETNKICQNKNNTEAFFRSIGVPTPKIYKHHETICSHDFPIIIKPYDGSCSKGVTIVKNKKEMQFFLNYIENAIIQEYVSGEEYTIDVYVDFDGKIKSVVPRLRIETRAGEVSKGMTVKNHIIMNTALKIAEKLPGTLGCLTIQCILPPGGRPVFLEINPRFGGGYPLAIQAGADFPRWIIEKLLGCDVNIEIDNWQNGIVMLRYDDAVFTTKDKIFT